MPVPPVTIPSGQNVLWVPPSTVSYGPFDAGSVNGSAVATLSSAFLTMTHASGLGNWGWYGLWGGFNIPAGVLVQAIYPVIVTAGTGSGALSQAYSGPNIPYSAVEPATGHPDIHSMGIPEPPPDYMATQSNGSNVGTSLPANFQMLARLFQTLGSSFYIDMTVSYIGLAVYYTAPKPCRIWINVGNTRIPQ